ncbi:MAG: hypothetical protein SOZ23_02715 [Methanosphaera sp.]|uniref:hypothetical protein n=1 Tax=Methanosphaera sp. TaxID=2666342 RepID=UPI0025CCD8E8|nr:hypothetical protein [Methanosphaera sp.]MCI5867290.1 hypothetical protein [Methanosphaera sp.]MDD6534642.1 hypothetical protein [Methanosphaera sp.]MDY3955690.1 hypothetical protein [Methanosphaera sp.]
MRQKYKILIIVLIVILIPAGFYGLMTLMNNMEQENFYNTIKNVSDNENITDGPISETIMDKNLNITKAIDAEVGNSKTLNSSIATLKELNESLRNDTLKEYVNIEIRRMQEEVKVADKVIKYAYELRDYNNGKISSSEMLSYYNQYEKDIAKLGTRVDDAKTDAMEFLTAHPDMKEKFDELGIDEDFMILEQGPKSSKT